MEVSDPPQKTTLHSLTKRLNGPQSRSGQISQTLLRCNYYCIMEYDAVWLGTNLKHPVQIFDRLECYAAYSGNYRRFGITYRSHLPGQAVKEECREHLGNGVGSDLESPTSIFRVQ